MNPKLKPILITAILLLTLVLASKTSAFTMQSENIQIQQGDIDFAQPTPPVKKDTDNPKQDEGYSGQGYTVTIDPGSVKKNKSLVFSISDTQINFGDIAPGEPITRTTDLLISGGSASGYQVESLEDHTLRSKQSQNIPDTTCDNGSCTSLVSSLWDNPLTYGFGYRCNSLKEDTCEAGFSNNLYFKPFSNLEKSQVYAPIISSDEAKESESEIIFKVNISQNQAVGIYQNTINYIAVPKI